MGGVRCLGDGGLEMAMDRFLIFFFFLLSVSCCGFVICIALIP